MCTCLCFPSMQAAGKILIWNMLLCAHIIGGLNASAVVANTPKTLTQKDPHFFKSHWQVSWYCISTYINLSQPSKYASASSPKSIEKAAGRACGSRAWPCCWIASSIASTPSTRPNSFAGWEIGTDFTGQLRLFDNRLAEKDFRDNDDQWCTMRVVLGWKMLKRWVQFCWLWRGTSTRILVDQRALLSLLSGLGGSAFFEAPGKQVVEKRSIAKMCQDAKRSIPLLWLPEVANLLKKNVDQLIKVHLWITVAWILNMFCQPLESRGKILCGSSRFFAKSSGVATCSRRKWAPREHGHPVANSSDRLRNVPVTFP